MALLKKEIQKFTEVNNRIRQEEIRARKVYLDLFPKLDEMVKNKIISDYEIEERYLLFSSNKEYCKSKNVEVGNPFFEEKYSYFIQSDEDFFNTNWNEFNWANSGFFKDLHFGYTMHCLLFHKYLKIEDILAMNEFWLDLTVHYQFIIES